MTQKTSAFTKRFFSAFLAMVLSFILVVPVAYADSTSKSLTNAKKISVDETITLAVSGWNCSVEWESSDPGIATVTPQKGVFASKAVVKGIKPGTVKVTATATRVWDFWWQAHKVTSEFEITVKEQSYTVKFVTNGGTRVASQNVTQGQTVTRPEDPVKCGYVFNGWYEDSELLYEYDFSTPVNSDMTLFAGWKKVSKPETIEKQIKVGEKVTLTYSANICAAVWISSDSDVAAVTSSSVGKKCEVTGIKAGTAFVTASPINIFSLIENKGTVIARYKIVVIEDEANENYTVTFESNGGSAVSSQNVKNGAAIVRPEDPIKEGFNFVGWYSDAALENEYDFASVVTSDITLYAKWEQNNTKYYTVNFDLSVDELVDNASVFSPQQVSEGSLINKPVDPISSVFIFDGWYTSIEAIEKFDFNKPITKDVTVFAKWNIDKTDSDNDGLYDVIEYEINTDYNKADTDSDGLNDYIEKIIGTDPLKKDSDQNGVSDYDEDADSDGLTNGYEVSIGTNPAAADTDCDGLNDSSEINDYETNPVKEDTDGDGANDSWEIINGYDPKVYNAKFDVTSSSEELTQYNHISASVKLNLDGNQAETLEIKRVSVSDNPLITPSIAGYLGCAYDFSVDGKFEQATITFNYDMDIFGAPNENFQPRIYYLNEETGLLEELKNQTVENGSVSTIVTHFSTYILLNKVEFDKIWENEIRLPDDTSTGITGLDIAIVIDSSGSMTSNDKTGIRLKAAKEFVDKLGENDRAAIIDFDNYATVYQGFTADHELLYAGIDKVDSSGGTSLSAGISKAINLFKDESYTRTDAYKYIVFLTDGDGSYSTSYTVTAAENGIVIYTIGLGSGVRESTLKAIAEGTGGKYYFASTATSLPNIYDDISFETIDYTTDSNNDGISDYYTELIYKGELPINNSVTEFKGVDFSISDDYDGDGLKNGQELVITYKDNNVYAVMKSDPRIKHSDSDGIDDYKEVKYSSDPLKYDVLKNATDALKNDGLYTYSLCVDEINNDWFQESMIWVNSLIYGVWNKDELYRDILIDYFFNYTKADYVEDIEFEESRKSMVGSLFEMIAGLVNTINDNTNEGTINKIYSLKDDALDLINTINGVTKKTEWHLIIEKYESVVESITKVCPDGSVTFYMQSTSKYIYKDINIGNTVEKVFHGIQYVSYGADIIDTLGSFAKVNSNIEAFKQSIDILDEIYNNSDDKYARNAAHDVLVTIQGKFKEKFLAVLGDISEGVLNEVDEKISELAKNNPYTAAVFLARDAIDLIFGISDHLERGYEMNCYYEMTTAINTLLNGIVRSDGALYYKVSDNNAQNLSRYLTHMAQLRILAIKKCDEWVTSNRFSNWDSEIMTNEINRVQDYAQQVGVNIDPSLSNTVGGGGGGSW